MLTIFFVYIFLTLCIRKSFFYLWLWVEPGIVSRSENTIITSAALLWPLMLIGIVGFFVFYGYIHIVFCFIRRFKLAV